MLQRFRLGTKLSLVVALALSAMVVIVAVGYPTLQRVKIGSEAYDRSLEYEQLIADVLPPPQYLVESYLTANRIVREAEAAESAELANRLRLLRVEYYEVHESWADRLPRRGNFGAQESLTRSLLVESFTPADTFWRITVDEFLPAIEAGELTKAQQLLDGPMTTAYQEHRVAIERVVTLAQGQRALHEQQTQRDLDLRIRVLAGTVGVLALGVAVVGMLLVRSIRRPVQKLTDAAHLTASDELPGLVHAIDAAAAGDPLPRVEPIVVDTQDELAELAAAFNSVRSTAVELAARQAATRRSVAEMFVNLGRRNQALINRQLAFIDHLEHGEQDPDKLDDLFRLDHLATRMRRNAESLLVLAGAEQPRRWSASVEIGDVVRSALSEIEDYHQVEVGRFEPVYVSGGLVADLAHLLAELLENATTFSPPTTPVRVSGRMVAEGYVLSVVDGGIGMDSTSMEDTNRRIGATTNFDQTPSKVLGLYVVGRLAVRHGVKVRLLPTPGRGVTVRVLLPFTAIEDAEAAARSRHAAALADAPPATVPEPVRQAAPPARDTAAPPARDTAAPPVGPAVETFAMPPAPPAVTFAMPAAPQDPWTGTEPFQVPPAPEAPTAAAPEPVAGLTRRVRGAQLPDTGPAREEQPPAVRSADDVRTLLNRFRAGVERGLQDHENER